MKVLFYMTMQIVSHPSAPILPTIKRDDSYILKSRSIEPSLLEDAKSTQP